MPTNADTRPELLILFFDIVAAVRDNDTEKLRELATRLSGANCFSLVLFDDHSEACDPTGSIVLAAWTTLLHLAVHIADIDVYTFIFEHCPDLADEQDNNAYTPLSLAEHLQTKDELNDPGIPLMARSDAGDLDSDSIQLKRVEFYSALCSVSVRPLQNTTKQEAAPSTASVTCNLNVVDEKGVNWLKVRKPAGYKKDLTHNQPKALAYPRSKHKLQEHKVYNTFLWGLFFVASAVMLLGISVCVFFAAQVTPAIFITALAGAVVGGLSFIASLCMLSKRHNPSMPEKGLQATHLTGLRSYAAPSSALQRSQSIARYNPSVTSTTASSGERYLR